MDEASTVKSIINNRNRDCLSCRIISGCGLIGSGLYVSHHSKKLKQNIGKTVMYSIGIALIFLGTTRIFNMPPFRNQFHNG